MKKVLSIVGGIIFLGLLIAAANIYWTQLRGVGPALGKPPKDIVGIIDNQNQNTNANTNTNEPPQAPVNDTNFPLKLPAGFRISIFAKNLSNPRVMAYDNGGNILVSIPGQGKVVAVRDTDSDGLAEDVRTVASGLDRPHGLAMYCATEPCKLYIAESGQVATYDYDAATAKATNKKKIIDLPDGGRHFSRTIMFMPSPNENKLLISVGSSCDVCHESDDRRAKILIANADGSDLKPFGSGLRNSVFMAIHPVDGRIWATEMGRDLLGDDLPPDEINIIEQGKNYGWPICYGKNIHDDVFDKNTYIRNPCMEPFETPSHIDLQAHSAPLGLSFIPEEGWPTEYWHNLLVSYHGSWNRSTPTGYKVVRFKLDEQGKYLGMEDFISGWLTKDGALGRPVDIMVQPGGTIYISDDKAGVIYKVSRSTEPKSDNPLTHTNLIFVTSPQPNAIITSPVKIQGQARGNWYFEASFPITVYDANGNVLGQHYAQAQGEWMTADFVPFESEISFIAPTTEKGYIMLHKDNPSALPEFDDAIRIPVLFRSAMGPL